MGELRAGDVNAEREVHVVVPEGIEDPARPSGGNTYDRRLCDQLEVLGWSVSVRGVAGEWPWAAEAARRGLEQALEALPDGSAVLVDGLVASVVPEVMVPASRRLRMTVLMHMPVGARDGGGSLERERAVLGGAAAVVTTSAWTRRWLLAEYALDPARVHVARPGVDLAEPAVGSDDGRNLLCVGAVTPGKGQDLLLTALTRIADLAWRCECVGSLTKAPEFAAQLRHDVRAAGLDDRLVLTGPRTGAELAASYAGADLLVLASRGETYGMVVTEALARALPVVAPHVGGVPEALGVGLAGRRPGILVPPGDPDALAHALRRWLGDADLRTELRTVARHRRTGLRGWSDTAERVAGVLAGTPS
jgi:glycosyltransferase involved in cell wall biosynthesis